MTHTLLSLISIFIGIIGSNVTAYVFKKNIFGFTGNTICGVFGSIFFVKFLGRSGFNPFAIMKSGVFHLIPFIINCLVSFIGGCIALILISKLKNKMNKPS